MLRDEELFLIRDLSSQYFSISEISRQTGFDRKTVRKYLQLKTLPEPQKRPGRRRNIDLTNYGLFAAYYQTSYQMP